MAELTTFIRSQVQSEEKGHILSQTVLLMFFKVGQYSSYLRVKFEFINAESLVHYLAKYCRRFGIGSPFETNPKCELKASILPFNDKLEKESSYV